MRMTVQHPSQTTDTSHGAPLWVLESPPIRQRKFRAAMVELGEARLLRRFGIAVEKFTAESVGVDQLVHLLQVVQCVWIAKRLGKGFQRLAQLVQLILCHYAHPQYCRSSITEG